MRRWKLFDFTIYTAILVHTLCFLASKFNSDKDVTVYILLSIIGAISLYGCIKTNHNISIRRNIFIFSYFFFFIAPWQQYSEGGTFWTIFGVDIVYTDKMYIKACLAIIVSLIVFEISNSIFSKAQANAEKKKFVAIESVYLSSTSRLILVGISFTALMYLMLSGNLTGYSAISDNSAINSQFNNMIKFLPVAGIIAYGITCQTESSHPPFTFIRKLLSYKESIIIIVIFFLVFFPLRGNMSRFFMMGMYIVLLSLFFFDFCPRSLYFALYYLGFVFLFTALRGATSIKEILGGSINFNHNDYDAFQMMMAVMKYTDTVGIAHGKNILSALAFFVPRSIWKGKMASTGGLALTFYGSSFTNVSSPWVGELYFAFGWYGVVIGSFLLAYVVSRIDSWCNSKVILKRGIFCVVSGMTIYICRGSLLPTVAFTGGLLVIMILISLLVEVKKHVIKVQKMGETL